MSASDQPPELITIERLVAALKPLPPVAQVLARLQGLLADPNADLDDIAALIRLDAALATRITRISNSVLFRRGSACSTIEDAVNRLGFREVYRVVGLVASGSIIAQPLVSYACDAHSAWRESITCAFAAEILAARLGEDLPLAYMCGLLHAIGRLPINQYLVALGGAAKPLVHEGFPRERSGSEFALLGFNQAAAGAAMLTKWEFPPSTSRPIQYQYEPIEAPEPNDRMAALLYAARLLRTAVCQDLPPYELRVDAEILDVLRLSADEVFGHLTEVRDQLARAERLTKV